MAALPDKVWAQPIPTTAEYRPAPELERRPIGFDSWFPGLPWSIPCYAASPADPLRRLLYNPGAWVNVATGQWKRSGNGPAIDAAILGSSRASFAYAGNVFSSISASGWVLPPGYDQTPNPDELPRQLRLSSAMLPAPGLDGHLAVTQPDGSVVEAYGAIVLGNGTVVALSYAITRTDRPLDGFQNGQTASMIPVCAGLLTDEEVAAGQVNHAIAVTMPGPVLQAAAIYPALAFDRDAATNAAPYAGRIPMGSRLALPASTDIEQLNLATPEGRAIAMAAKTYGFIVVDRGGEGITVRVMRNADRPAAALRQWAAPLQSDLAAILAKIAIVQAP